MLEYFYQLRQLLKLQLFLSTIAIFSIDLEKYLTKCCPEWCVRLPCLPKLWLMHSTITGSIDMYLIAGDPVARVRAPEVFNLSFQTLGIHAVLVPVQVSAFSIKTFDRSAFSAKTLKVCFWRFRTSHW